MDRGDYGGIYPHLTAGKTEGAIQEAFESFYAVNVSYDMTRQRTENAGPFEYDYRQLSSSGTRRY